jgi:hypothetical protein
VLKQFDASSSVAGTTAVAAVPIVSQRSRSSLGSIESTAPAAVRSTIAASATVVLETTGARLSVPLHHEGGGTGIDAPGGCSASISTADFSMQQQQQQQRLLPQNSEQKIYRQRQSSVALFAHEVARFTAVATAPVTPETEDLLLPPNLVLQQSTVEEAPDLHSSLPKRERRHGLKIKKENLSVLSSDRNVTKRGTLEFNGGRSSAKNRQGSVLQTQQDPSVHFRHSLRATFVANQVLLTRINKTVAAMDQTSRTNKRLAAMMDQQTSDADSNSRNGNGSSSSSSSSSSSINRGRRLFSRDYTIHPGHLFRCVWPVCVILALLYYSMAIQLRIWARYDCGAVRNQASNYAGTAMNKSARVCLSTWDWSLVLDYLCDAILVADFVLRARCFSFRRFEGEREIVEVDLVAIFQSFRYGGEAGGGSATFSPKKGISLFFYLAIWLLLPLDVFAVYFGFLLCFRLAKLPVILLLPRLTQEVQQWLERERSIAISAEAITVFHLSVYTCIVLTCTSAGWGILQYGTAAARHDVWVSAVYWCFTTATTTGYGDITPVTSSSTLYNVFITIIGPTIFAIIVGKIASYVKK